MSCRGNCFTNPNAPPPRYCSSVTPCAKRRQFDAFFQGARATSAVRRHDPAEVEPPFDLSTAHRQELLDGFVLYAHPDVRSAAQRAAVEHIEFVLRWIAENDSTSRIDHVKFAVAPSPLISPNGIHANGYHRGGWVVLAEDMVCTAYGTELTGHELAHAIGEDSELGAWRLAARWLKGSGEPERSALASAAALESAR